MQAVKDGANWVAQQIREGRRRLDADMVTEAVSLLGLRQGPARAIVSIATLKPDPLADQAVHRIEWFDRLEGADAFAKRRPAAPATWAQLQREIEEIPQRLGAVSQVAVTGSLRQATAFTVGATLRMVTNVDLATIQRGELWSSSDHYGHPIEPTVAEHSIGQGHEIAIAIEVATRLTDDVLTYVRNLALPVDRLVVLGPPAGPNDRAIPDSRFANA